MYTCANKECPSEKLAITNALVPHTLIDWTSKSPVNCANWPTNPGSTPEYPLCCDPPYLFNKNWPVKPEYLWSNRADDHTAEVAWDWADDFGNNNLDIHPDDLDKKHGADPYGFVMLDGPPGSINNAFHHDFTVLTRDEPLKIRPRALITSNATKLDAVFEHAEETVRVYCNHPPDSQECRRTFYRGAEDTIIRLPHHVGEGPWARIVSMEPDHSPPPLPSWVIRKRQDAANSNGKYAREHLSPCYPCILYLNLKFGSDSKRCSPV
jgi:hypothetical protein